MSKVVFIRQLQLEYLTYKLRSLIYRDKNYAQVAAEVATKKRNRIVSLGKRYGVQTIFDSGADVRGFVVDWFWRDKGLPVLTYRDEEQKKVQFTYDAWGLLYRGTDIYVEGEKFCVVSNNPSKEMVWVRRYDEDGCLEGDRIGYRYEEITLINSYKFVD